MQLITPCLGTLPCVGSTVPIPHWFGVCPPRLLARSPATSVGALQIAEKWLLSPRVRGGRQSHITVSSARSAPGRHLSNAGLAPGEPISSEYAWPSRVPPCAATGLTAPAPDGPAHVGGVLAVRSGRC